MPDNDLQNQLEGLFPDTIFGPEVEPEIEEESELLLEEAIASLLKDKDGAKSAAAESAVTIFPSIAAEPEELRRDIVEGDLLRETPLPQEKQEVEEKEEKGKRAPRLATLLRGATVLGGAFLIILLLLILWQRPAAWSWSHVLYFTACTVAITITLIQWWLNSSMVKTLQETEERHNELIRSQRALQERANELATTNAALQKRTFQLQSVVQVSQTTLPILDLDELMQEAVDLTRERFDLHYVGLFLIDSADNTVDQSCDQSFNEQWAVLRAGTGEAGQQMIAQDYRIAIDENSTVGWAILNAQPCNALDLSAALHRHPVEVTPQLPKTRSEVALPLRSRGDVIGALDVRSVKLDAFSQEDIAVLQTIADHIAVAIENAQLFAEMRDKLEEIETRQRRQLRQRWDDFVSTRGTPGYERTQPEVAPLGDPLMGDDVGILSQAIEQALTRREVVVRSTGDESGGSGSILIAPISLRDEVIGVLGLQEEGRQQWTDDEITLIETIADQMALAIENARLLDETQQRAEQERLITEITARVRASMDPDTILRTAVRELGAALGTDRAFVKLGVDTHPSEKSEAADVAEVSEESEG